MASGMDKFERNDNHIELVCVINHKLPYVFGTKLNFYKHMNFRPKPLPSTNYASKKH